MFRMLKYVLHGLRLVAGFSSQPVPAERVEKAKWLLREYIGGMMKLFGDTYASYANHNVVHLVEDVEKFECHLDRNSAYAYENFHALYSKMLQPGKDQHAQIRERLIEKYVFDIGSFKGQKKHSSNFTPGDILYLQRNVVNEWTNEIPANVPRSLVVSKVLEQLKFEGFTLRNSFPQNVCLIKRNDDEVSVVVCEGFEDEGDGYLIAFRCFREQSFVYDDPYDSRDVRYFSVSRFDTNERSCEILPAERVVCKCAIFPVQLEMDSILAFSFYTPATWQSWVAVGMID